MALPRVRLKPCRVRVYQLTKSLFLRSRDMDQYYRDLGIETWEDAVNLMEEVSSEEHTEEGPDEE